MFADSHPLIDADPELFDRLARNEWAAAYDRFVDLTNKKDAAGNDLLEWPPGLFDRVIAVESAGFDARRSSPAELDAYARLVRPVYQQLPTYTALRRKVLHVLDARYARPEFVRLVQPVRGYAPDHWAGPYYHGTRALDAVVAEGICARAISYMVDPDPIGSRAPESWWARYGDQPPMSAVDKAQNRGYDFGYSWLGYWREAVFNWYAGLDPIDQRRVAWSITGLPKAFPLKTTADRDFAADQLGDLTLFFITERRSTAERYGRGDGGVLEVDPHYAQAFDIIADDLQGESSYAIIIPPGICPQIDWRGLKYKGTPLGGVW